MRAQRQEIHLLQTGGASDDEIMLARGKYRALSGEYTNFSKAMNLPQQRERVTVDGLGNVGAGKYTESKEPAKIPSLGSKITDRVTDEERRELLKQGVPSIGEQLVNALNARKEQVEKSVAISGESGIIEVGSDSMAEITQLGRLNTQPLEREFGKLKTDEIIVTNERIEHIRLRHPEDYEFFEKYGVSTIEDPDLIVTDGKHDNTVFMVKRIDNSNLNVVAKLILDRDEKNYKNSVMTFYRIRNRNLKKLIDKDKNKVLYKKE